MNVETADETATVKPARSAASPKPFSTFERMIAWRYLRSRRKEAYISVIAGFSFVGIMLGVATLIVVMAVMNGFRAQLIDRILGVNGHMILHPMDQPFDDFSAMAARLSALDGVDVALPLIDGQVLATGFQGRGTGALVRGMRPDDLSALQGVSDNIISGNLLGYASGEGVAIGSRMASSLGLIVGDSITLTSPEGDITPLGVTPRTKAYPVSAIFEIGMSEFDSAIVFMPLQEAQLYFNTDGLVQSIELVLDDPESVDELRPLVEETVGQQVFITDWRQQNRTFFSALEVERNVMFMILTLIVLVAALNIISGLIMLVKDKSHDIAILRTMGATSGSVLRIFFMTGATIGIVGTIAGFGLGVLICWNVELFRQFFSWVSGTTLFDPELYYLSQLPAEMDTGETFSVVVMAIALSFLATIFPAWRASRLDPVDALRYE